MFAPFKVVSKTCPRSSHRGGCASRPVYPLKYRAARAVSQVRGGGGLSASGSFCFVLPSFSFSFSSFDITILARLDFFCKWPAPFCFKCNIYNSPFLLCTLHKAGVIFALYFCTSFTNFKPAQNFFKVDYCTSFVYDCTNCQFLPLFTLYSF